MVIAALAAREDELEQLTGELIEANDQRAALHELSTSSTTSVSPDQLPERLAHEAHRLLACGAVAVVGGDASVALAGAHELRPLAKPLIRPDHAPEIPAGEAERRPLTVMFCDLADSTALSSQLDPEKSART